MNKEDKATRYVQDKMFPHILNATRMNEQPCFTSEDLRKAYLQGWDAALGNQWISVKDTLPDVGISVLVLTSNSKVSMSKIYQPKDCHGNDTGIIRWNGSSTFDNSIVAWMPIPSFEEILEANKDVLKRLKSK